MTIYSPMPEELIFQGMDEANYEFQHIQLDGIDIQVQMVNANQAKIVRIFSPIADHYLNPSYSPGTIITFPPAYS
ncbi:YlzJ-like family protein [Paenibacillus senegalensis]|uniref:YlzJ-like family protein n=1 Tax=Paenibacillus senegalensis TaxID=1465766 RepID=UPI00028A2564|nr:YlzJ-like family protein [Paenibacillus senegalensis]